MLETVTPEVSQVVWKQSLGGFFFDPVFLAVNVVSAEKIAAGTGHKAIIFRTATEIFGYYFTFIMCNS